MHRHVGDGGSATTTTTAGKGTTSTTTAVSSEFLGVKHQGSEFLAVHPSNGLLVLHPSNGLSVLNDLQHSNTLITMCYHSIVTCKLLFT